MTDEELKRYVDAKIKEALKSYPTSTGIPLDPGQERRLKRVELSLVAVIQCLRELLPDSGFREAVCRVPHT